MRQCTDVTEHYLSLHVYSDTDVASATRPCDTPTVDTSSKNVTLVYDGDCKAEDRVSPEAEHFRHRGLVNLFLTQVRTGSRVCASPSHTSFNLVSHCCFNLPHWRPGVKLCSGNSIATQEYSHSAPGGRRQPLPLSYSFCF